jgi:hypothetical protein
MLENERTADQKVPDLALNGWHQRLVQNFSAVESDQLLLEERPDQGSQFAINVGDGEAGLQHGKDAHNGHAQPFVLTWEKGVQVFYKNINENKYSMTICHRI